ncbi:hypothetical protein ACI2LF_07850 [Kribbella sp. NPDC020789]
MPTHEWAEGFDPLASTKRKTGLVVGLIVVAAVGVVAGLKFAGVSIGAPTNYSANVDCRVNTVGNQGTVTITGTITGDSPSYTVTVDVLDASSQQRIGGQTFEVRGTNTFGGTTPAQAGIGSAGIDCKIVKVA